MEPSVPLLRAASSLWHPWEMLGLCNDRQVAQDCIGSCDSTTIEGGPHDASRWHVHDRAEKVQIIVYIISILNTI